MDLAASEVEKPASEIFPLPAESCLLFSAVSDRDNFPFFEGFRLDIMISKNAQGGLPGWDRNPELPAALCKRKNGFKQSGKRLPRSPKISRRRGPKLGREDGKAPSVLGLSDCPEGKPISKNKGEAAKDRMKKGHTGDPGITDRKALKSFREISAPKAAVDSEKRIRYP